MSGDGRVMPECKERKQRMWRAERKQRMWRAVFVYIGK